MVHVPTAQDWMATSFVTLKASDGITEAMRTLIGDHFSAIPVVDDNDRIVGVLSEKDCLRTLCRWAHDQIAGGDVADSMSEIAVVVTPEMDLLAVAGHFLTCNFSSLPVQEDGHPVGTISRQDVLTGIREWHRAQEKELELLHTPRSGHERPSAIEEMQRTLGSHTLKQLSQIFRKS